MNEMDILAVDESVEISETVEVSPSLDYAEQIDQITSLLLLIIFFMGIIAGLISAKIMWGRVK